MAKKTISIIAIIVAAILAAVVYTQLTIFVIPPIGAVPEGRGCPGSS